MRTRPAGAVSLYDSGVDVLTSGNHIWENRQVYPLLDGDDPVIRPLNYPDGTPGDGIYKQDDIAVINLMGRAFMGINLDCPFRAVDRALAGLDDHTIVLVDLHAEATSEKVGMGHYLDGRVSAVIGTHTHIPTADARVLPKGTAYISDLGMVGALNSVLGMETAPVLERFLTQRPNRWNPVDKGPAIFNSVIISIDRTSGRATNIERVDREVE